MFSYKVGIFNLMKIILTGVTGMVGEGVLLVCLENLLVTEVLSISRKPSGRQHAKLKELVVTDFAEVDRYGAELSGYDACFFCAGVSSIGENEVSFSKKTFDFVVPFAETLLRIQPAMTFVYVSGRGTDEHGKAMWAKVKGRTENALMRLPFKAVYCFRPGFMKPVKGQRNVRGIYRAFEVLYPLWLALLPKWACSMREVGLAMINCVSSGYDQPVLEVNDIRVSAVNG